MKSSQGWAHSPGHLATKHRHFGPKESLQPSGRMTLSSRSARFEACLDRSRLFYIPEHEIPQDIENEAPKPEDPRLRMHPKESDRGVEPMDLLILPFVRNGLRDCRREPHGSLSTSQLAPSFEAQKLMMQINFCGDWASKAQRRSERTLNVAGLESRPQGSHNMDNILLHVHGIVLVSTCLKGIKALAV